jgi:hypothetical protein
MPPSMRSSTSLERLGASAPHGLDQVAGLQRASVEGGPGDLSKPRVAGQAEQRARGVGVPPRRAQAR